MGEITIAVAKKAKEGRQLVRPSFFKGDAREQKCLWLQLQQLSRCGRQALKYADTSPKASDRKQAVYVGAEGSQTHAMGTDGAADSAGRCKIHRRRS